MRGFNLELDRLIKKEKEAEDILAYFSLETLRVKKAKEKGRINV